MPIFSEKYQKLYNKLSAEIQAHSRLSPSVVRSWEKELNKLKSKNKSSPNILETVELEFLFGVLYYFSVSKSLHSRFHFSKIIKKGKFNNVENGRPCVPLAIFAMSALEYLDKFNLQRQCPGYNGYASMVYKFVSQFEFPLADNLQDTWFHTIHIWISFLGILIQQRSVKSEQVAAYFEQIYNFKKYSSLPMLDLMVSMKAELEANEIRFHELAVFCLVVRANACENPEEKVQILKEVNARMEKLKRINSPRGYVLMLNEKQVQNIEWVLNQLIFQLERTKLRSPTPELASNEDVEIELVNNLQSKLPSKAIPLVMSYRSLESVPSVTFRTSTPSPQPLSGRKTPDFENDGNGFYQKKKVKIG